MKFNIENFAVSSIKGDIQNRAAKYTRLVSLWRLGKLLRNIRHRLLLPKVVEPCVELVL